MRAAPAHTARLVSLTLAAGVLAGCALLGGSRSDAGEAPLIEVSVGSFEPLGSALPAAPVLTIYPDGQLISAAPTDSAEGGGAIPALVTGQLDAEQVDRLLEAAGDAGLLKGVADEPPPDDMFGIVTLTLRTDGATYVHRASALYDPNEAEGPAETPVLTFLEQDLGTLVPEGGTPYEPTAYAVVASFALVDQFDEPSEPVPVWPLDDSLQAMSSCHVVDGADADAVEAAARDAGDSLGLWNDAGVPYLVSLRPLLPHESACPE